MGIGTGARKSGVWERVGVDDCRDGDGQYEIAHCHRRCICIPIALRENVIDTPFAARSL